MAPAKPAGKKRPTFQLSFTKRAIVAAFLITFNIFFLWGMQKAWDNYQLLSNDSWVAGAGAIALIDIMSALIILRSRIWARVAFCLTAVGAVLVAFTLLNPEEKAYGAWLFNLLLQGPVSLIVVLFATRRPSE